MADIKSIDMDGDNTYVTFKVSESEYQILKLSRKDLVILPTDDKILNERLTTGKLGNGNRIMMPNKLLERHEIEKLIKKVPAKIFHVNDSKYLLIKLEEHKKAVPVFEEMKNE